MPEKPEKCKKCGKEFTIEQLQLIAALDVLVCKGCREIFVMAMCSSSCQMGCQCYCQSKDELCKGEGGV